MFHVKRSLFVIVFFPFFCLAQHFGSTVMEVKTLPAFPRDNQMILDDLKVYDEFNKLSDTQKEWFYWTNYSRRNSRRFWDSVVSPFLHSYPSLQNSYTESLKKDLYNSPPLPLVRPDSTLINTSKLLAVELANRNASPSHTSPSGSTFADRMKAYGIKNCAGENISYGPLNPVIMLILLYIDQGVPDLGHRKALLNSSFVEMGVYVAQYKNKNSVVVQDFACKQR